MLDMITPTTELEAVNVLLSIIAESPVNSLLDEQNADTALAQGILTEVLKEVQSDGWHFNTDIDFPMPRNTKGEIKVPHNCVLFIPNRLRHPNVDVTIRGRRLYDRKAHTYTFSKALVGDAVWLLKFDDIPEQCRRYVVVRAGRIFADRVLNDESLSRFTQADEARARSVFVDSQSRSGNYNIHRDREGRPRPASLRGAQEHHSLLWS